jgi:DNA sulfur modification protein DndB
VLIDGKPRQLRDLIALNGKIKTGQLWTLKQYTDAVPLLFNQSVAELNKLLVDEDAYCQTKNLTADFFKRVLQVIKFDKFFELNDKDFKAKHKSAMFSKALFVKGLVYLGQSMFEEAFTSSEEIDWTVLEALKTVPLDTLSDDLWIKHNVCWIDSDTKIKSVKIHKSSDKKIARVLCKVCRVFPSMDI